MRKLTVGSLQRFMCNWITISGLAFLSWRQWLALKFLHSQYSRLCLGTFETNLIPLLKTSQEVTTVRLLSLNLLGLEV